MNWINVIKNRNKTTHLKRYASITILCRWKSIKWYYIRLKGITSNSKPRTYIMMFIWTIKKCINKLLSFTFDIAVAEPNEGCIYDWVEIQEIENGDIVHRTRECGYFEPGTEFEAHGYEVILKFRTDISIRGIGFWLKFEGMKKVIVAIYIYIHVCSYESIISIWIFKYQEIFKMVCVHSWFK